jgi:tRNA (mo5U34)-methyltransferase
MTTKVTATDIETKVALFSRRMAVLYQIVRYNTIMNLEDIRKDRERWMGWKNIAPLRQALVDLPEIDTTVSLSDAVTVTCDKSIDIDHLRDVAKMMKPWRKGPFDICGVFIDSEWRSNLKYDLLRPHFNLHGKKVADIGCNNGYYMFRMQEDEPKKIVGFDPSALFKTQFDFINHFVKSEIIYELLGVEHLPLYQEKFDTIFCLGVLYHRSDPVAMLKHLYQGLEKGGEIFLDTFYIDGDEEIALSPKNRYSKIPNIYFIPTVSALNNWSLRAGFCKMEVLEISSTSVEEQRKTEWIDGESLHDFLDPDDTSKTVEGYPAPKRLYVKLYKD